MNTVRDSAEARRWLPNKLRPANRKWPFSRETVFGKHLQTQTFNILIVTCLALFTLTASVIARTVSEAQNSDLFRNLAESALHRSEHVVDDMSVVLAKLVKRSAIACKEKTLLLFQAEARHHAAVNDFRIVDSNGRTLCSSNAVAPQAHRDYLDLVTGLHSHDGQIRLVALGGRNLPALGVFRALEQQLLPIAFASPNNRSQRFEAAALA